ncbi:hypothetical protein QBC46DRAFT_384241 [Diplogelasinospora grovesii]|uniref:Uncharacterized protein n=1 Tax=Diplogelasinospora grovesii TaxID=303347 RepID=A0AAN6NBN0_9PEZI|nr:hypothetical protein QBC46DRAFT_384241 [Diplogelasinospora grovesii]
MCVGIILGVAFLGVGVFLWWRRRQKRSASSRARPQDPQHAYEDAQVWKPSPSPAELHTEVRPVYEMSGSGGR